MWRFLPFVVFLLLGFFFWRGLSLDPQHLPSARLNQRLPVFHAQTLMCDQQTETPRDAVLRRETNTNLAAGCLLSSQDLKGRTMLLNVWASWCATCEEEHAFLMKLAHEGVTIYGLNYKDNPHDAQSWLAIHGNPYVTVGEDRDGRVAIDLGVYGAPETFLIDDQGFIRYRHTGALTPSVWRDVFLPKMMRVER